MFRLTRVLAIVLGGLTTPLAHAEDFTIDLRAQAGQQPKHATARFPAATAKPRPVLTASTETPVTVKWTVKNADTMALKDVLVHFFAVREEGLDQPEVPKLTKNVIAESALTSDFRPRDQAVGEITFTVAVPGFYLIRLELKGAGKDGREPFAALDLVVR